MQRVAKPLEPIANVIALDTLLGAALQHPVYLSETQRAGLDEILQPVELMWQGFDLLSRAGIPMSGLVLALHTSRPLVRAIRYTITAADTREALADIVDERPSPPRTTLQRIGSITGAGLTAAAYILPFTVYGNPTVLISVGSASFAYNCLARCLKKL